MWKYRPFLAVTLGVAVMACCPEVPARSESSDLGCRATTSAVAEMRGDLPFPPYFSEGDPAKRGGEFDPNRYFGAFTDLRMADGFTLDYVYHQDGLGGYPILYARPLDREPYADEAAYRAAGDHPDYLRFVVPRDSPEGYFEYAAFAMTASQFYLDWHANYNDWQVVCGRDGVEDVIAFLASGSSPGPPMSAEQQQRARAIEDPDPAVTLTGDTATVTMVVFTKWGGFQRRTLSIGRSDHVIRDEDHRPLVDYECGVVF